MTQPQQQSINGFLTSSPNMVSAVASQGTNTTSPALSTSTKRSTASPKATTKRATKRKPAKKEEPTELPLLPLKPKADVMGQGMEALLSYHSMFKPKQGTVLDQAYWESAIQEHLSESANIRLELGGQSYDLPYWAAGKFYHKMFTEGNVSYMHVGLGKHQVHLLDSTNVSAIVSFHDVQMTTTYTNGRRVVEMGDLRVIFDRRMRIRVWAFTSADVSICLPRKRPNGPDDALTRTADATIGRNLEWPNGQQTKRRKSAPNHGKQPPEECGLPAVALRHLEMANALGVMQELMMGCQREGRGVRETLAMWKKEMDSESPSPSLKSQATPVEKKPPRVRKKSNAKKAEPTPKV